MRVYIYIYMYLCVCADIYIYMCVCIYVCVHPYARSSYKWKCALKQFPAQVILGGSAFQRRSGMSDLPGHQVTRSAPTWALQSHGPYRTDAVSMTAADPHIEAS